MNTEYLPMMFLIILGKGLCDNRLLGGEFLYPINLSILNLQVASGVGFGVLNIVCLYDLERNVS